MRSTAHTSAAKILEDAGPKTVGQKQQIAKRLSLVKTDADMALWEEESMMETHTRSHLEGWMGEYEIWKMLGVPAIADTEKTTREFLSSLDSKADPSKC